MGSIQAGDMLAGPANLYIMSQIKKKTLQYSTYINKQTELFRKIIFTLNNLTTKAVEHDMLCGHNTTSLCSIKFLILISFGEGVGKHDYTWYA